MKRIALIFLFVFFATSSFQLSEGQEGKRDSRGKDDSKSSVENKPQSIGGLAGIAMLTSATLKWNEYGGTESFMTAGYKVYRRDKDEDYDEPVAVLGPVLNWTDCGLEKNRDYFYKISAYDVKGTESSLSSELELKTWENPPFQSYRGYMNVRRITTLDVLCLIYGKSLEDDKLESIKKGMEQARMFVWRNSRCRLNLNIIYLIIEENLPGKVRKGPSDLREELDSRGYKDTPFDIVFVPNYQNDGPSFEFFHLQDIPGSGHGMGKYRTYPVLGTDIDYNVFYSFLGLMQSYLDRESTEKTKNEVLSKTVEYGYGGIAEAIRAFDEYESLGAQHRYIEVIDVDDDGLPDSDPRVAMDEDRLPSNPQNKDTDNDYLDDMDEFSASIWRESSNTERDTDGDGLLDGKDRSPLVDFGPSIRKVRFVPDIDGKIEDTWRILAHGYFWSNVEGPSLRIYAGWDDEHLYFAFESEMRPSISLEILDGDSNDNESRHGYVVEWDKPQVISDNDILENAGASFWIDEKGNYQTEMRIPFRSSDERQLNSDRTIGLSIEIKDLKNPERIILVTEPYGFYKVTLEK